MPLYSTSSTDETSTLNKKTKELDMPWSEWQEWALHDHLPKYLIHIPGNKNKEHHSFALWHTMIRDVTELSGYDVGFVRKMHTQSLSDSKKESKLTNTPAVLPLLDDFQFEPNGGITGKVYGLAGIANGAMIQTPPLDQSQLTIPNGYVMLQLDDDDDNDDVNPFRLAYELGDPLISFENDDFSINTKEKRKRMLKTLANTVSSTTLTSINSIATTSKDTKLNNAMDQASNTMNGLIGNDDTTEMLVKIGGLTTFLLSGATIMNAFHHHLTVNVFWV